MSGFIQSGRFGAAAFDPTSLSNLVLWLDAADTASITDTAGKVTQWDDKSGGGNHFTQSTDANRPITNSRTENGLNALDFDGTNDRLMGPLFSTAVNNLATYLVLRSDVALTGDLYLTPIVLGQAASGGFAIAYCAQGSKTGLLRCGVAWHNSTTNAPSSGVHILTTRRNSGTWAQHLDTASTGLSTSAAPNTPTVESMLGIGYTGGGYTYLNGLICEVLWYEAAHDDTTRATVESYLKTKWGTP